MTNIETAFEADHPLTQPHLAPEGARKPRIAIMGEFSAGKSTLSNLLIGVPSLPVQTTATQLPPVWISYGDGPSYLVNVDGTEQPFDLSDLRDISVEDTMYIRVFHKSDALELCDLIDMPGISDPNMSSSVWERVLEHADGAIWCSHATQAWRQSEAAVWSMVNPKLFANSLLLLTRIDKVLEERDRQRVVRRVESETDGLFAGIYPISLLAATEAGEDFEAWQKSGAEAFAVALIEVLERMAPQSETPESAAPEVLMPREETAEPDNIAALRRQAPEPVEPEPVAEEAEPQVKVVPRRSSGAPDPAG